MGNAIIAREFGNKGINVHTSKILRQMVEGYIHPLDNESIKKYMDGAGDVSLRELEMNCDFNMCQNYFTNTDREVITQQAIKILSALEKCGLLHRDFRVHNLMYDAQNKKL